MKKENKKNTCNLPLKTKINPCCGNIGNFNIIKTIRMDKEGNCYDDFNNYIGKGDLKDGRLIVTRNKCVENYYFLKND